VLAGLVLAAVLVAALAVWRPGAGASPGRFPNAQASVAYERGRFLLAQNAPDSSGRAIAFRARAERTWGRPGLAELLEQKHSTGGYAAAMAAYFESKLAALDAATPATGFDRGRLLLRLGRMDEAFAAFD
jgi:hypothetical protein